jgi:glycosyltransferase involved in cell wall biosynthesis
LTPLFYFCVPMTNLTVVHIQRKPVSERYFSIENSFSSIRKHLPHFGISPKVMVCQYISQGFWPRLQNTLQAAKQKADIYHVTGDVHYTTLFLPKKRTVLTIHDCVFMQHPSKVARAVLKLFWLTLPAKRSSYIVCVSEKTKKEILRHVHFPEGRMILIPSVVNEEDFKFASKAFNNSKPTILQIGTTPNKNIERVAAALKKIPCRLEIVGALSEEQKVALEENQIDYHNEVGLSNERIAQKYKDADLLLFVSTYEGFGMPILEAQLSGIPVITSNLLPMNEVAGEAALLVDPFDVSSISKGIQTMLHDEVLRAQLIEKGKENAQRYSASHVASMYAQLYKKMLAE